MMKAFLKTTKGKIIIGTAALLIILLIVLLITKVIGGEEGYRNISVSEISGSVMTENGGKKYEAYKNMRLADGYALTTDTASYTRMVLDSDKYVKLEEKSRALFEALGSDKQRKTAIRLEEGILTTEITAPLGDEEDYIVNTPNAVLAVRGTFFKAAVRYDTNGDAYTDVYTYGGTVVCKRVMPDGTIVDEEVMINSGYKARIKMDEVITIYIEELIEEDEDNVDPIDINEVPDGDIVDVYNAAVHGHEMFAEIPVLWQEILKRDIDLNDYHSVYDGGEIPSYDNGSGEAETEEQTDTAAEMRPETETNISEASDGNDISEEYDDNYDVTDEYYPAETSAAPNAETSFDYTERDSGTGVPTESVTTVRTESYIYTEPTEHTHSPYTEIFEDEPVVTEVTSVTTAETAFTETTSTEIEPIVSNTTTSAETVGTEIKLPVSNTETSRTSSVTTEPDVTVSGGNASQTGSGTPNVHVHNFAEYIPDGNATCTEDGTKTAVCSCGERDTVIDTGSAGHNEAREVTEATFISEGNIRIYCSVCGENIGSVILPRVPLYIDDGSIVISETGYSQGGGEEIPYTGDYNISQRNGSAANSSITVISGSHNITLNGIDTSTASDTFTVESGAAAAIYGGNKENKLSATGGNCYGLYANGGSAAIKSGIFNFSGSCGIFGTADSAITVSGGYITANGSSDGIRNSGAFTVSGGNISAYGGDNGIWNNGGFAAVGGSLSAEGGSKDIKTWSDAKITGGSVRAVNSETDGKFVNAVGDELECEAFDVFPSEAVRTFENSEGDKYVYGLAPEDKARDGYYYIWKPKDFTPPFDGTVYMDDGSVTITADGISQGGKVFSWTEDIVISQKDRSAAFDAKIAIESGTHNITFDGININSSKGNCVEISSGASVSLGGSVKENIIASAQEKAINNSGTLRIDSGAFKLSGGYCGLYNFSQAAVNGGRISVSGEVCDIFNEESGTLTVSGGSVKSENSAIGGKITNASGDELECKVYGEYTGNLTFTDGAGNEYAYKLDVGDSIDGGYYVWQPKGVVPEGVAVNEENFPDEVFRNYVSKNFDKDSDGYLSYSEIEAVTSISVRGTEARDGKVASLKGIEHFDKLNHLYCCFNSGLTSLDVSNNTALITLYCYYTSITSLDVSNNTALKYLYCNNIQITSLDVSQNAALQNLWCHNTQITSLDVSNNTALTDLYCDNTPITRLDLSRNTALTALSCPNTQIKSLDLSSNVALEALWCGNNKITSLDLSNNTALTELYCQKTEISHLDFEKTSIDTFYAADCEHYVTVVNGKFDTKTIDGFDHTRASNCAVKDKNGNIIVQEAMDSNGVIKGIKEETKITYWYDCGRGFSEEFTLAPDDKSTFEPEETSFNGTLDLSAGAVTITSEGFVQNGVTTPWTGDYTISGGSSSAVTVESGRHNIIIENADISAGGNGLTIAEGAEVTISGSGTFSGISVSGALNTDNCDIVSEGQYGIYISGSGTVSIASGSFDLSGENSGIFCAGKLEISGGSVASNGGQYGIMNASSGVASVSGGKTSLSGGADDIYSSGRLAVTGGSVRAENGTVIGSIVNADGAELECAVFDAFPSEAERTFTSPDGSEYVYKLTEGDRAADGKYYVWKPKAVEPPFDGTIYMDDGSVTITSDGFTQNGVFTEWTGVYTITQNSANPLDVSITVESGMHDLTLDGINIFQTFTSKNISTFNIKNSTTVTFNGTDKINTISVMNDDQAWSGFISSALENSGDLEFNSGMYSFISSNNRGYGIYNYTGRIQMHNAVITAEAKCSLYNLGTFIMDNGELYCNGFSNGMQNSGTFISNGGHSEFTNTETEMSIAQGGVNNVGTNLTINNGEVVISGVKRSLYNQGTAAFNVTGGKVSLYAQCDNTSAINISGGEFEINNGRLAVFSNTYYRGAVNITGGNLTLENIDIYNYSENLDPIFNITGGSINLFNNIISGKVTSENGDTLVCTPISDYTGNIDVTTANGTYTYTLRESDRNADGLFYVWLPEDFDISTASILDEIFDDETEDDFEEDETDFPEQDIFDENITTDIPEQVGEDDIPPENTEQDNGGENISEDVPEQEVIGDDTPAEPEQSIPDMLLDAVIITAAALSANIVDITIFAADIVIYLISILMKLWR